MKTADIKRGIAVLIFCSLLSLQLFAQNKLPNESNSNQYIHIKTMRIENGDTIITEKNYESNGNGNIQFYDSLMQSDETFDFNFQIEPFSAYSDSIYYESLKKMEEILLEMNSENINYIGDIPNMNFVFPMDTDSLQQAFTLTTDSVLKIDLNRKFIRKNLDTVISTRPFPNNNLKDISKNDPKNIRQIFITTDNRKNIPNSKYIVENFNIYPNSEKNLFNLSFNLDSNKPSRIKFENADGNIIYEETIGKGTGLFTRQFNLNKYSNGVYYISISQGKKFSSKRIILQ